MQTHSARLMRLSTLLNGVSQQLTQLIEHTHAEQFDSQLNLSARGFEFALKLQRDIWADSPDFLSMESAKSFKYVCSSTAMTATTPVPRIVYVPTRDGLSHLFLHDAGRSSRSTVASRYPTWPAPQSSTRLCAKRWRPRCPAERRS
jgi:hypothetical protein